MPTSTPVFKNLRESACHLGGLYSDAYRSRCLRRTQNPKSLLAASLSLATAGTLSALLFAPASAHAQAARTYTWTGSGGNNAWETNGNWSSNLYPDSASTAVSFLTGIANTLAVLNSDHSVYGITFGYNSGNAKTSFTISGKGSDNTLNLYAGGIVNNTALTQTIDASVALRASQSFNTVASGTLSFTPGTYNQINLLGNTLNIVGAGNTSIASTVVDSSGNAGQITESSAGILTLSNNGNSFTGNLNINQGTLIAATAQTSYNPSTSVLGSTMTGGRLITVGDGTNVGVLNFAASQVFGTGNSNPTVGLVINAGSTITNSGGQFNILPNLTMNGGTLTGTGGVSGSQQMYSFAFGSVTVGGSAISTISGSGANSGYHLGGSTTFNVADVTSAGDSTDLLVSGNLIDNFGGNGAGSLVKTGSGTMTLTGSNTYTGTTTINGGTLNVGTSTSSSSLGKGTGNVTNNGNLSFNNTSSAGSATITNNNALNGYLSFNDSSSAGNASITNNQDLYFNNVSSGGSASIINMRFLSFGNSASGGGARITNNFILRFNDSSSAGTATITNNSDRLDYLEFNDNSSAGSAIITNNSYISFVRASSAGSATITNNNTSTIYFGNTSSAGNASITNNGNLSFNISSSAGSATIISPGIYTTNNLFFMIVQAQAALPSLVTKT